MICIQETPTLDSVNNRLVNYENIGSSEMSSLSGEDNYLESSILQLTGERIAETK